MRGHMDGTNTIRGVAGGIGDHRDAPSGDARADRCARRDWGVPAYLIDEWRLLDLILTLVTAYVAYYLYLAYAEGIVGLAERGERSLGPRGMLSELARAVGYVPSVIVAALIAVTISTLAMGLLLIPGI